MAGFVTITHPDLPDAPPARVTETAFKLIHEPKGWKVDGDAPATDAPTNTKSLSISEQVKAAKQANAATETETPETPPKSPAAKRTAGQEG